MLFILIFIGLALWMEVLDKRRPSFLVSNLEQIFFYLAEITFICGGLVVISWAIYPVNSDSLGALIFNLAGRFITLYAVYQIFVLVIVNLIDSAYIDQYNALLRLIEMIILYRKNVEGYQLEQMELLDAEINRRIGVLLHRGSLVSNDVRDEVRKIKELYLDEDWNTDVYFKRLKIQTENNLAIKGMFWQGSILLKILKEWPL